MTNQPQPVKMLLKDALTHARQLEWKIRAGLAALDMAPELDDEQSSIRGWTGDDLDSDETNAGSVKIFPPTIEGELDSLPPHEGHGGSV